MGVRRIHLSKAFRIGVNVLRGVSYDEDLYSSCCEAKLASGHCPAIFVHYGASGPQAMQSCAAWH